MGLFRRVRDYISYRKNISSIISNATDKVMIDTLKRSVVDCKEYGVTKDMFCDKEVIVSLTSHSSRIPEAYIAIESIMQGVQKPNRIILWLSEEYEKEELPATIKLQKQRGLEVKFRKDIGPYTKQYYALKEFPDSIVVSIDDDIYYDITLLDNLVRSYKKYPKYISANRVLEIKVDSDGMPLSYWTWNWDKCNNDLSPLNYATGVGGVLYPPKCFDEESFDIETFLRLAPKEDDAWWYCMALRCDIFIVKTDKTAYFSNNEVQDIALSAENLIFSNKSDTQMRMLINSFHLQDKLSATKTNADI